MNKIIIWKDKISDEGHEVFVLDLTPINGTIFNRHNPWSRPNNGFYIQAHTGLTIKKYLTKKEFEAKYGKIKFP